MENVEQLKNDDRMRSALKWSPFQKFEFASIWLELASSNRSTRFVWLDWQFQQQKSMFETKVFYFFFLCCVLWKRKHSVCTQYMDIVVATAEKTEKMTLFSLSNINCNNNDVCVPVQQPTQTCWKHAYCTKKVKCGKWTCNLPAPPTLTFVNKPKNFCLRRKRT